MLSTRSASTLLFSLLSTLPLYGVTYTPIPSSVVARSGTFTLEIRRTISAGEEGYSADEMDTFQWFGPPDSSVAVKLPAATLVSVSSVRIGIDASLLRIPGPVTIRYIADPYGSHETREIQFTVTPADTTNPPRIATTAFLP